MHLKPIQIDKRLRSAQTGDSSLPKIWLRPADSRSQTLSDRAIWNSSHDQIPLHQGHKIHPLHALTGLTIRQQPRQSRRSRATPNIRNLTPRRFVAWLEGEWTPISVPDWLMHGHRVVWWWFTDHGHRARLPRHRTAYYHGLAEPHGGLKSAPRFKWIDLGDDSKSS